MRELRFCGVFETLRLFARKDEPPSVVKVKNHRYLKYMLHVRSLCSRR